MSTFTTSVPGWSRCTSASNAEAAVPTTLKKLRSAARLPRLLVGVPLASGAHAAFAAAIGSFATSLGMVPAVATWVVVKGWPGHVLSSVLSAAFAAVVVGGGAGWLLRAPWAARLVGATRAPKLRHRRAPETSLPTVDLPPGFDRDAFLAELRSHYIELQAAWDSADGTLLEAMVAPELLAECRAERARSGIAGSDQVATEVVSVIPRLVGFERLPHGILACVEFSGQLRDAGSATAMPFRELCLLTRPDGVGGWRLSHHQALL